MNRKQRRAAKAGASPVTADALNARGLALVTAAPSDPATLAQAIDSFHQAVRQQPDHVDALSNLGAALHSAGRDAAAIAACRQTLALAPTSGRAFYNLGIALKAQGRLDEAVTAYRRSLVARPNDAETLNNLGNALIDLDRPAEAEEAFRTVLSLNGQDPGAASNLGVSLQIQGLFDDSITAYRQALAWQPDHQEAQANLASVFFEQGRFPEAIAEAELALRVHSISAAAHNNLGVACLCGGRLSDAIEAFRSAISHRPNFPEAHYNLGTALLQAGQYTEGWREYEWRWRGGVANLVPRPFVEPRWAGEELSGRTILLWAEQGLGDVLHFARGASLLAARGATVILEVYRPLVRLMASVPGVARVVASGDSLPPFDYHLPLMSVPHLVGAGVIAADTPYIRADDGEVAKWRARLAGRTGLKVGLVWSGDPRPHDPRANAVDRRRSMRLAALAPLLTIPGICFVSLQKGKPAAQLNDLPADIRPLDWMDAIGDFADTAALTANLDLVISVDTSVAHLAGALGKPVWIASRFDGCWRWLEDRDDSPWYPSARLFRQEMPGAWGKVIERMVIELEKLAPRPRAGGDPGTVPSWVPACAGTTNERGDAPIPCHPDDRREEGSAGSKEIGTQDDKKALFAKALRHHKAGDAGEAEALYRRVLGDHPDHPPGLYNLGLLLLGQGRAAEAAPLIDRAIGLQPADPLSYYNLGFAYQSLGRSAEAAEAYRKSLALRPDNADARNNLGIVLLDMRQTTAAQAAFRAAIDGRPDFAAAHYNLARALLLAGDYPAGWREYEWRWQSGATHLSPRPFRQPPWTGENLAGRTILLHGEQGLGDVLQFARFATAVAALGARVVVEAQAPLVRLLASLPGVGQVVAAGDTLPPFDLHLPLLSAPSVLGTTMETIPAAIPYVTPDPAAAAAWRQRLAPLGGSKVGLVWAGAEGDDPEAAAVDCRRSLPLAALSPLLSIPGISFVSLQKGAAAAQIAKLPEGSRPHHWMDEIGDFADTAALVDGLDLVITVDTSVAHLVGAMGKPVWILSRFDGCWRWLEDRDDSPWYPTARLFRQKAPGAWDEVIERVAAELEKFSRRPSPPCHPDDRREEGSAGSKEILRCAQDDSGKGDDSALFPQAVAHHQAGRLAEAEGLYRRLIAEPGPAQAAAHSNLGVLYRQLGRMGEAAEHFRKATLLKADYAEAFNNLGLVHNDLGNAETAVACYRRTLALAPDHPHALTNLGAALQDLRRIDEAMAAYRRAMAVCPDLPGAHYNLGQALLLRGDYRQGWREYDWLWKGGFPVRPRNFTQPRWSGEDLAGRTILLYAEQGLGDVLHFVRYASVIAAMGGRVIVEVYPPLKRLLAGMAGVAEVVAQGEPLPPFDLHLPLMAAPGALGTTVETIPTRPYVFADRTLAEAWRHRLAGLPGLKVGLVWAGEPRPGDLRAHVVDRRRSLALARLMPLLSVGGVSFVSLQKGTATAQIADLPEGSRPRHWMDEIGDFADTAALVDGLDLVITVDTSVAHLVGAMGKPVWILSRFDGCWRWLEDRDDTPWYPTARLFRQKAPGAWDEVIERVAVELEKFSRRPSPPCHPDAPSLPRHPDDQREEGSACSKEILRCAQDDSFAKALEHHRAGRFEEAAALYRRILENDPTHFDSLHHLGLIALWSGDAPAAVRWISLAIVQDRRHAGAHDNLGLALAKAGRPNDAALTFHMALELDPERAEIHYHLGAVLHDLDRFDEAATAYRNTLALRPDFGLALTNLGSALGEMDRFADAIAVCHRARLIDPAQARPLANLGASLHELSRIDEAIECYRQSLALDPHLPETHHNLATALLLKGQYAEGWPEYEWRWKGGIVGLAPRSFDRPMWQGEDLAGRTILLHGEQGLGDVLHFARFATPIAARGARVVLEVYPPLVRLLATVPGVAQVVAAGQPLPDFDCHLPLMSAPLRLATTLDTVPAAAPYVTPDPGQTAAWAQRLAALSGLKVGLAWAGDPRAHNPRNHAVDRRRSMALATLAPLLGLPGISLASLQKGQAASQLAEIAADLRPFDAMAEVTDFADTAALIANLDLVITVDTSVAHLAGALGKPVWILNRFNGCWRWLEDREDSPWYPTARLFRQTAPGAWDAVVTRVAEELTQFTRCPRPRVSLEANPRTGSGGDPEQPIVLDSRLRGNDEARLGDDKETLFAEALHHHQENHLDQAEELYRRILAIEPGQPVVLCHLGLIAHRREMPSAASALIRRALAHSPTYVGAWSNLGIVLREMGSPAKAVVCFQRALQLRPDLAEPRNNLGGAYRELGRLDDAIGAFRAALALQPDHPEVHCNLAAALLERGDYEEGWREHEWRLHPNVHWTNPSPLAEPLWQGEDLNGRTILLRSEQGLGDDLQFARFAAPIAALGARVILEVPAALTRLLKGVPGVSKVTAKGEPLPPFDCYLSLMSAPSRLGTTLDTIPGQVPYLAPEPAQIAAWGKRLKRLPGLKVGLVWAGDPRPYDRRANAIDQRRSMRLGQFEPLLARPKISVVSLQKGAAAGQIAELPPELRPLDVMDEIADFADTAALVATLDLVITVDTSVAHLAGAMGKPVWIASRFDGCWRWLSGRDDSPWYPTARLFRQRAPGDWDEVVARMVEELNQITRRPRESGDPEPQVPAPLDSRLRGNDERGSAVDGSPSPADLFALAVDHHRAGRLAEAEALYRRILKGEPGNVGSLFHLGLIAQQCGHHGAAIELFGQAVQRNDQVPGLHDSLGTSLAALGRLDEAIEAHRRAIGLKGDFVEAFYNLGNALMAQGRHQPAIICFWQTLACRPDLAEPYNNLGNLFSAEGATEQAVIAFERAVRLAPGEPAVHNNLGNAYKGQERMVEAEACFRRALALAENYAEAHYNLANLFLERGDFTAATAIFRRVITLRPDLAEAYNNLGSALHMGGRTAEAVASFHRVLVLDPSFPEAHTNLGSVHREQGEHDLAIAAYRHAIGLAPDYPLAHSNLAMVLLLKGDYDEGLKEFEWRRRSVPKVAARIYAGTPWTGQDLAGRSILLYAEQGLGDALQFARYAPILAAEGAKVVLEVYPPLTRLLATVPGVAAIVPTGGLTPAFDFHLSMVSLPHLLGTRLDSIPASVPYVSPDAEQAARWGRRLGRLPGLKVGLVWAGDPRPHDPHAHAVDRRRSMAFSRMAPLLSLPGVSFVSLQKGGTATQLEQIPAELRPLDPMDEIGDFADTAALVANLDLVISVDTSVVHLAGAMGRPVWILSRFDGCWRWLENRDDSPWYPSARLFRQRAPGDWDDVIERVAKELTRLT